VIEYVLDTNSLIVIGHYFPDRFPTFRERFNAAVADGRIVSVREVRREFDIRATRPHPVQHFQQLVGQKQRLKGSPVADPFVIAGAAAHQATVISEEEKKPDAANIPNVCRHFSIPCRNLEWLMATEGWVF